MSREVNYSEIGTILDSHEHWYVLSHVKPDGDTLGAACALYASGIERGKRISWVGESDVPLHYMFLPFIENYVKSSRIELDNNMGEETIFICVDTSTLNRSVGGLHEQWKILNIDHHADNIKFGTYYHIEPESSSVCEIIWSFMKSQNWNITKEIAIGLYTGITTDTGRLKNRNKRKITHYAAADLLAYGMDPNFINLAVRGRTIGGMHLWGIAMSRMSVFGKKKQIGLSYLTLEDFHSANANHFETEFLVNQILLIHGVEVVALIIEDDDMQVRVSIRSTKGSVSSSKIAKKLGGGGHMLAAGAICNESINDVITMVLNMIEEEYAERDTTAE
jgi:phosphoesterase RecJ-like protein